MRQSAGNIRQTCVVDASAMWEPAIGVSLSQPGAEGPLEVVSLTGPARLSAANRGVAVYAI
jgi:hypothetical protein